MSLEQNRLAGARALAAALWGLGAAGLGCAGFGIFEASDPPPVPATMEQLRAAIEDQRALLLELVSETGLDDRQRDDNADDKADDKEKRLIAIAQRLTQLTDALEELESKPNPETNSP